MRIGRSWVLAAFLSLSAVSLGACSGDDGGSGGSGGSGGTGDGGAGNTGQGATGQGGAGAGGAGQGGAGQGGQTTLCTMPSCYICANCTKDGACQPEWDACLADLGCTDLYTCYQGCMDADTACRMTCDATYPDNAASFGAFRTCFLGQCMNCPM